MHVTSVGCGVGMSLIVVDRANVGGKLEQLDTFDGDADAIFQENTKELYFPPRRNGKGKPNTYTSQHPAVDETGRRDIGGRAGHQGGISHRECTVQQAQESLGTCRTRRRGRDWRSARGGRVWQPWPR
uniref:Uncharacterized protein n=1 Tax=Aegilops tauschii subsp. strangulata TaxID=200361 RepID=A0A452XV23_AEGTS